MVGPRRLKRETWRDKVEQKERESFGNYILWSMWLHTRVRLMGG